MSNPNSQEYTIYQSLAGQIQLGFYDDGEPFPSASEIAAHFGVSYCPAQRALKLLEKDGLVRLCRGKSTEILARPYDNYLTNRLFLERAGSLADLSDSLKLISTSVCLHALPYFEELPALSPKTEEIQYGKELYILFRKVLKALGSHTVLSLYYDAGAFIESAYLDILKAQYGSAGASLFLQRTGDDFRRLIRDYKHSPDTARIQLNKLSDTFYDKLEPYFKQLAPETEDIVPAVFSWEPHKGRLRYCDIIAIDMVCKINLGLYPVGTLLPKGEILATVYHVSPITIRRTIHILNALEVVHTINGVGTRVITSGSSALLHKFKDSMLDENMKSFLEALQLLTITCDSVLQYSFPHFTKACKDSIQQAVSITDEKKSMVSTISAVLQAVIRCCPLSCIKEVYGKLTLQMMQGGVLRLDETGAEHVPGWAAISADILDSCAAGDGRRFAHAFCRLAVGSFTDTKKYLMDIGIGGLEEIASPVLFPDPAGYPSAAVSLHCTIHKC